MLTLNKEILYIKYSVLNQIKISKRKSKHGWINDIELKDGLLQNNYKGY